ncbi:insecticidal delta-endotoxin Cry8Ea1 family protein [Bacillus cereus]|uniref:insecticidal delta-endotoxin Cry8Ea1 family protein n=1 Tax=Bacillus cereus group sp. MYBK34-1 TaxID=3450631 RepID=UPI003F7A8B18|nr:insecticidal delta-endotoxin Cry8Ea1 family protein [Bacillus cereus]
MEHTQSNQSIIIKKALEKIKDPETQSAVKSLVGDGIKQAYEDTKSGDFTRTIRTLTLGALTLIPYGGAFVSQILGVLWVTKETNPLKVLEDQIKDLEGKVKALNSSHLKAKYDVLMKELQRFEDGMNHQPGTPSFYDAGSIEQTNRMSAQLINSKFKDLIKACEIEILRTEELPIYTLVATAHLVFLQIIQHNWKSTKLQIDQHSYDLYYKDDIQKLPGEYLNHIMNTYKTKKDEYQKEMQDVVKGAPVSYTSDDGKLNLKVMQDKYDELYKKFEADGRTAIWSGQVDTMNKLRKAINDYITLMTKKNKYYYETAGNEAFQLLTLGKWVQENGNWHFVDNAGLKKTGWLQLGDNRYYFSPTTRQMVTGKFDIENKTYYFKPNTGEMETSWIQDGDTKYYFSPADGTKNYAGTSFKKGEMMTGFVQLINKDGEDYYYFSPTNDATNDYQKKKTFKKGEMWTGWLEDSGKWYYMNKGEKATRDKGIMLHDEKIELDNGKGVKKWYNFDYKGVGTNS